MEPLWTFVLDSKMVKAFERAIKDQDWSRFLDLFGSWGKEAKRKSTGVVPARDIYRPTVEETNKHFETMGRFENATPEQRQALWDEMMAWAKQQREHHAESHQQRKESDAAETSSKHHGKWQGWVATGASVAGAIATIVMMVKGKGGSK